MTFIRNIVLYKRSQIFAEMYRQHPERLFTNLKQRFDLMFNGKFAYAQVCVLL